MEHSIPRVYGISFLPKVRGNKVTRPELVVTADESVVDELFTMLANEPLGQIDTQKFLGEEIEVVWPEPNMWIVNATKSFGVSRCAYVHRQRAGEVEFRFPLVGGGGVRIALTLQRILIGLGHFIWRQKDRGVAGNRTQLIELITSADTTQHFYGHAVGGNIYPQMRAWLWGLAESKCASGELPSSVTKAMRAAWRALTVHPLKQYDADCFGRISTDGRFWLSCFGNACDLGIYPDSDYGPKSDVPTPIGCHNLDASHQQLTLLAGLAELHTLAERELG